MKSQYISFFLLTSLLPLVIAFHPVKLPAQHVHVNAGAKSVEQGASLYFTNGEDFDTRAGYNVYLAFTNSGSFSNLYQGAGITFAALASTPDYGGPAYGHAADGAFLQLKLVSLRGPPGSEFGVWVQEPGNPGHSHPLITLPVGWTGGTNLLALSEGDGSPGADPYGHIHGRTFTATSAGLYTLGCQIVDTSVNGEGGGPIHAPSELYYFYFQAGPTISSWRNMAGTLEVTFGTTAGKTYFLESTHTLAETNWTTVGGPFAGNNHLQTTAAPATHAQLFLRLRSN
jgi:hypothetical protein